MPAISRQPGVLSIYMYSSTFGTSVHDTLPYLSFIAIQNPPRVGSWTKKGHYAETMTRNSYSIINA